MSDPARRPPSSPDLASPNDDERSVVRDQSGTEGKSSIPAARPRLESTPELPPLRRPTPPGASRPPPGSLDDRIEQKLRIASALLEKLPATDPRVRLLHVAVLRRDESLLDGVLAELAR